MERRKSIAYCGAEEDMTKVFVDKRLRQVTVKASLVLVQGAIPTAQMTKVLLNG